jgi:nitrate reductase gamma subunit
MEYTEFQHATHIIGTSALVVLYLLRLLTLRSRRAVRDRSTDPRGDLSKGIWEAFLIIVMPWKMDSTRRHWFRYVEFMAFHLGVFTTIFLSFAFTYAHQWIMGTARAVLIAFIAVGLAAGLARLVKRATRADMRAMSSFDDYFSISLVLGWEVTALLILAPVDGAILAYFAVAFFLLLYEPFSKLRHYIYYPFARVFFGRTAARRGVIAREVSNV